MHKILELPAIPRKKDALKVIIATARKQQRKTNLIRFASFNFVFWGLAVPIMYGCSPDAATGAITASYDVFLPVIIMGQ